MVQEPDFLQDVGEQDKTPFTLTAGTLFLLLGFIVFFGVIAFQLTQQQQTQPIPGDRAPHFELVSYEGITYDLEALRGQIVVINLWADWCIACHAEAEDLQQIHQDYGDRDVLMIGINWLDIDSDAARFIERYGITYPNAPDMGEKVYEAYHAQGLPETFVINREGIVAASILGGTNYDSLSAILDRLLAEDDA